MIKESVQRNKWHNTVKKVRKKVKSKKYILL